MQGDIQVASYLGFGSVFTIHLKSQVFKQENEKILSPLVLNKSKKPTDLFWSAILGDKDQGSISAFRNNFQKNKIKVQEIQIPEQIIQHYRQQKSCCLIILDSNYDDKDGILIAEELRQIQKQKIQENQSQNTKENFLYILMINQNSIEKERFSLLTDQIDKFIIRPVKQLEIRNIIQIAEQKLKEFLNVKTEKQQKQILLIDDEPMIVHYYQEVLDLMGVKNHLKAYNGKEGYELFTQNSENIELIILDYEMPMINGIECARLIREFSKKKSYTYFCPILICSGNEGKIYEEQAKSVDALYEVKPLKATKIEEIIKNCHLIE